MSGTVWTLAPKKALNKLRPLIGNGRCEWVDDAEVPEEACDNFVIEVVAGSSKRSREEDGKAGKGGVVVVFPARRCKESGKVRVLLGEKERGEIWEAVKETAST
eukprot:1656639-Rhodomonas_salina.1